MLRRSHFVLVKALFEQSGIVLPTALQPLPRSRQEQAMIAAIDGMLAEGRRAAERGVPKRVDRTNATIH